MNKLLEYIKTHQKNIFFVWGFLYIALLNILIVFVIPVYYATVKSGAYIIHYSILKHIVSNSVCIAVLFHMYYKSKQATTSSMLFMLVDFFYFMPGIVLIGVTETSIGYYCFYISFWVFMVLLDHYIRPINLKIIKHIDEWNNAKKTTLLILLILFIAFIVAIIQGASFSKFSLGHIYENRLDARDRNTHWLFIVLSSGLGYVIPVIVAYCVINRRYLLVVLGVIIQLFIFTIGSERVFLYNLIICLGISSLKINKRLPLILFSLLWVLIFFENKLPYLGYPYPRGMFMRQALVPNELGRLYFSFFTIHEPDWLRSFYSPISRLFGWTSPYQPNIPRFIGSYFYGNDALQANNGLIGGGMGNFGLWSIVISPLGYVLGFRIIDAVADRFKNEYLKYAIAFSLIVHVVDSNNFLVKLFWPTSTFVMIGAMLLLKAPMETISRKKPIGKKLTNIYMGDKDMQRCSRCIMDNSSDSTITFDENGFCNYCTYSFSQINKTYFPNLEGEKRLNKLLEQIKSNGKKRKYDCIMGLSGGLDSSYLAYLGHKWGLRVLAIHIDDGFDTDISKDNIAKLVKATGFDFLTITPDSEQFNALTKAYMKAGVPNIAVPQDNILFAFLYSCLKKYRIKYFLSGGNFALESILQKGNTHKAYDAVNIMDINKRFGTKSINKLKFISTIRFELEKMILKIESVRPLNYIEYNRDRAFNELSAFCGFEYYGRKHLENTLTEFIQLYWFPKKFGVDKRTSHLSSMIVSGQMTREQALEEYAKPLYNEEAMLKTINLVMRQLNITDTEFDEMMRAPVHQHTDFKTEDETLLYKFFRFMKHNLKTGETP